MCSYEKISMWLHVFVASIAVLTVDYFEAAFKTLQIGGKWYLVCPLILSILGMNLVDILASSFIENFRWLRRLIAGENDIEGDWTNIVVDAAKTGQGVLYAEYTRIRYHNGQYVVSGDTWALDGSWKWSFCSEGSRYRDHALEYFYKTGYRYVGGYGVIRFTPADALATDFMCQYLDEDSRTPHITRGRIISRWFTNLTLDQKRAKAIEFVTQFQNGKLLDMNAIKTSAPST